MSTKQQVLTLLRHSGAIFSGEKLAQEIGVSRTAIWKAVRELEKMGYIIQRHANGYQYLPSDVLENTAIGQTHLPSEHIFLMDETESTMKVAKLAALNQQEAPALYIAETQTGGHGRFGRPFFSPKGQIYMSLLLNPNQSFEELPQYTLLAAVAVSLAIDEVTGRKTDIKWVNDIYLDGKKICGILSEATSDFEAGRISHVILGMGINFSIPPETFPDGLEKKASSLFPDGKPTVSRNQLIQLIWQNFFELLDGLPDNSYLKVYREKSFVLGKTVSFVQQGVTYSGIAKEISDTGELLVETSIGLKNLSSGEISLQTIG
ncbi:biotin--[acetyl-CoA-carboxylase] ligase [Enterococcus saccharolyticus]|uniref:biotin--[acetyl-CoA-carboxylase] ligase n=1 Tax=Enterococcus saccharolyticus TaxID=41997 RepID=UPI001E5506C5|nr:biotin--[acetyl-CoA-carboxylase] ligase [Enterococcus saccharolyticus]MCD5001364.1 biotin--[acetyl-CoA-carboxylase] ligase [Enterococcus saccharolyticus]